VPERRFDLQALSLEFNEMEGCMRSSIISRLKTIFGFFLLDRKRDGLVPVQGAPIASDGREPSAREYELYYWCATPAPWY